MTHRIGDGTVHVRMTGDRSRLFIVALGASWMVCVALPLAASEWLRQPFRGLPLLGVAIWFVLLRVARRLSPPAQGDRLLARGRYAEALALCERELAVGGRQRWQGNRRIAWLNRQTNALLGVGRLSAALTSAMEALSARPDAETLALCAQCLLWLNRYDEAGRVARLALTLTRERSINALAVLAGVLIAQGQPAEAQALAVAGLNDISALLPFVNAAHHVALVAALCRAERALNETTPIPARLRMLQRLARHNPLLRAQALMEEADSFAPAVSADSREHARVFGAFEHAIALAPHAVCWYLAQPYTLYEVRDDPGFEPLASQAHTEWLRQGTCVGVAPDAGAPPAPFIEVELSIAAERGYAKPTPHSSRRALAAQGVTLAGTLLLLAMWTWQFFLVGS
ncbi:MAG TPA: tetratricopeptide repeat protein [Ktedonobacterales bacterium]